MPTQNRKYILLFAALFIPYILLCFFAYPVADDFHYALWQGQGGYWQFQLHDFFHWNGRYASNPLIMLNPIKTGSVLGYQLVALLLIVLTPLSFYFLVSSLFKTEFTIGQRVLGCMALSVLYLGLMPDIPEGIYWMTGAVTYHLGDLLAILYIGLVVRYFQKRFLINALVHLTLSIVLLFIVLGFNEVFTLLLLLAHVLALVAFRKDVRLRAVLFGMALCTIFFSQLMILAPGNAERSSYFTNNHNFVHSFYMTGLQIIRFSLKWISFPPLLLASILFIPIAEKLQTQSAIFRKLAGIKLWQVTLALLASIFICVFPAYWGTGILGQHRTLNTGCFFFMLVWLLFVCVAVRHFKFTERMLVINTKINRLLVFLFIACLLLSGNSGRAIMEFAKGDITGFGNDMQARFTTLQAAKQQGIKDVFVPALHHKPSSLFVLDLQADCNHWINGDYANYFGVEKVCIDTLKQQ